MKRIIVEQDAQYLDEAQQMNNFIAHLPGGFYRDIASELLPNGMTYREYYAQKDPGNLPHRSEVMLGQTPAEFYSLVDTLLDEQGITSEQIAELFSTNRRKLMKLVATVFIKLRQMGYTDYELNV